jgi:hypothetical protein
MEKQIEQSTTNAKNPFLPTKKKIRPLWLAILVVAVVVVVVIAAFVAFPPKKNNVYVAHYSATLMPDENVSYDLTLVNPENYGQEVHLSFTYWIGINESSERYGYLQKASFNVTGGQTLETNISFATGHLDLLFPEKVDQLRVVNATCEIDKMNGLPRP